MALAIALIDAETGLFMALNFDLLYRIPAWRHPRPVYGQDNPVS